MIRAASGLALTGIIILSIFLSCTDASLYGKSGEDPAADRLGLKGRVCTDDPKKAGFPVRIVFLIDTAIGPMFSNFDPELSRLRALRETLGIHSGNDAFSFAVIGMAARSRLLAPSEGYFTRNPGELDNAIAMTALPEGCLGNVCRDYSDGLNLAQSIIEGDLADMNAGERSRTQYAIILMAGGPPAPFECRFECCDLWGDQDCDYSQCRRSFDCTKSLLREKVGKLRDEIEGKGASSLSLHVAFLAASDTEAEDPQTILTQTEEILKEMAFQGAGRFDRFNSPDQVTLDRIGLRRLSALFEAKSLFVTNMSALPSLLDPIVDSDRDGLGDLVEKELGTDHLMADSDGDGIRDMVETLVSFNPLVREEKPSQCIGAEGPPYSDIDGDHLNECEELLLGTNPSLPDTDGDAIMDWLEVSLGTDYLRADTLNDDDGDGAFNGDEVKQHTDPRSSDASSHLGSAYRYEVEDEGVVIEPSISSPNRILGVTVLSAGADTSGGLGTLRYTPGPPPKLSWQDPQDTNVGSFIRIKDNGIFQLPSASVDESALERWISVEVDRSLLPPSAAEELLLVALSERHCLSFTVRNIRLVETEASSSKGGQNEVFIYFAQAPAGRLTLPGLFRVAHIPVTYNHKTGRVPGDLIIEVNDDEFASVGY